MQIQAIETIRIPHDASPRVRTAAGELARWIEQFGGSKTPIGTDVDTGTRFVKSKKDRMAREACSLKGT